MSSSGTGTLTACSSASFSIGKMGVPVLGPACGSVSSSSSGSSLAGLLSFGFDEVCEVETGTSPPNGCETKSRREQSFDSQEQELWLSSEEKKQEQ